MKLYLDHSMIEIYLNKTRSMTLRNYCYTDGYRLQVLQEETVETEIFRYKDRDLVPSLTQLPVKYAYGGTTIL